MELRGEKDILFEYFLKNFVHLEYCPRNLILKIECFGLPGTLQSVKRDTIVHSALQKLSLSISIDEGNKNLFSGDKMEFGGSVWLLLLSKSDN